MIFMGKGILKLSIPVGLTSQDFQLTNHQRLKVHCLSFNCFLFRINTNLLLFY